MTQPPANALTDDGARSRRLTLWLSYVGFVSLGLPDTLLGAAWPAIRGELGLPLDAAGAALLLTTAGVVLSSTLSGHVRARWGTGAVLVASSVCAAAALAATALAPSWGWFLAAAFTAGLGGGAIDASLNDFVARRHSARAMSWLHACWGIGATIGPAVVAAALARGHSFRAAYALLAGVELVLGLSFVFTRRMWNHSSTTDAEGAAQATTAPGTTGARSSVAMFFVYGGLEAGTGLWASSLLTETRATSASTAGAIVAAYWGALTVGRIVIGAWADRIGPTRLLRGCVWVALAAVSVMVFPAVPTVGIAAALAVLGLALAPVYPVTMHDTVHRFGPALGGRLVGYQVAATSVGVATVPWLLGTIARRTSLLVLPPCLVVLAVAVVVLEARRRRGVRLRGETEG